MRAAKETKMVETDKRGRVTTLWSLEDRVVSFEDLGLMLKSNLPGLGKIWVGGGGR